MVIVLGFRLLHSVDRDHLTVGDATKILWACSRLGVRLPWLTQRGLAGWSDTAGGNQIMCDRVADSVTRLNASNIATVLCAMASMSFWHPRILEGVTGQLLVVLRYMTAPEACSTLRALGSIGFGADTLIQPVVRHVVSKRCLSDVGLAQAVDALEGLDLGRCVCITRTHLASIGHWSLPETDIVLERCVGTVCA